MVDLKKFSCGLFICAILAVFIRDGMAQQSSAQMEQQRHQFMQARNALRAKQMDRFKSLTDQLRDYPLYPYLLQLYLSSNLWRAKDSELIDFLERYGDLPTANDLRRDWLRYLARHGRWQTFVDNYTSQNDETLRCYHLHARLQTQNHAYLLEDARSVWLSGKSLPPQCDTVFALLYKSDLFTEDLIWQRIRLAMAAGNTGLAKYLSGFLKGNDNQWARRWLDVHSNSVQGTQNPKFKDLPIAREILAYGIQRLVKVNIDLAISRWRELRDAYSFNSTQIDDIDRVIAINAASKKHAQAREILEQVRNSLVDEEIFHWRLATALRNKDWERLKRWTEGDPPIAEVTQRWRYWRARAYAATGNQTAAEAIHRITAQERDYYGFLAADELRLPYAMDHRSLPEDLIEWQKISVKPAIVRARELYLLGMIYSARREWRHAFHDLTSYQLQIAAGIAADWGWHDQVILTLGEANAHDDLNLRFPLPYEKLITSNAQKRQLELSWVYALTRAESIFIEDAQSSAGALGLMQVMPATGRETARILGIEKFMTSHLLEAATNVPIGTEYLRRMYERFNRNIVLATAAYNAGPGNVLKWLPENGCVEPEIWIEQIPFEETRKYVQRILYFASIYDWRLGSEIKPVRARMAVVTSDKNRLVAGLNCTGERLAAIH
jgi:soluble lytic murein transglycosylase